MDIHNHWLRQEYTRGSIILRWKPTKDMIADGLTKALPGQRFKDFTVMIGLVDIRERLRVEKRLEELRDQIFPKKD